MDGESVGEKTKRAVEQLEKMIRYITKVSRMNGNQIIIIAHRINANLKLEIRKSGSICTINPNLNLYIQH